MLSFGLVVSNYSPKGACWIWSLVVDGVVLYIYNPMANTESAFILCCEFFA